jgi:hypothetical protein
MQSLSKYEVAALVLRQAQDEGSVWPGVMTLEKMSLRDGREAGVAIQLSCQVWIASLLRASQ